jgi:hypothetical protein
VLWFSPKVKAASKQPEVKAVGKQPEVKAGKSHELLQCNAAARR